VFISEFLPVGAGELWLRCCSSHCSAPQPFSAPQDASLNIVEGSQGDFFLLFPFLKAEIFTGVLEYQLASIYQMSVSFGLVTLLGIMKNLGINRLGRTQV